MNSQKTAYTAHADEESEQTHQNTISFQFEMITHIKKNIEILCDN